MTEALQLMGLPVLVVGSLEAVNEFCLENPESGVPPKGRVCVHTFPGRDVTEELVDLEVFNYIYVEVCAAKHEELSEGLKLILQKAKYHGIEILDHSPRGSMVKQFLRWHAQSIDRSICQLIRYEI